MAASADELGVFEAGFASWSRVLAISINDEVRLGNFRNMCLEAVSYVGKGLAKPVAVDELLDLAQSHGLTEELGQENVEAIIAKAFEAPPPEIEPRKTNGTAAPRLATPYLVPDPTTIPPRAWLHGGHYIRQATTATVAPGGFGKTTLTIHEAISMVAAGLVVWYLSGEDPKVEIDRRIAAHCQRHAVALADLPGKLFVDDRAMFPMAIASSPRVGTVKFDDASLVLFEHAIVADKIDVVMLDPFIAFHTVAENDNGSIDAVVKKLAAIAQRTDSCIEISHHVRKPFAGQGTLTVDDARGGSAIIAAVRSGRVINRMSIAEAEQAHIPIDDRHFYIRIDKGKRNMAPPERATWFHLVSVILPNGDAENGKGPDNVQALEAWEFPKAVKPSEADFAWLRATMKDQLFMRDRRSGDEWLGYTLAAHFNRDPDDEADAKWLRDTLKYFVDCKVIRAVKRANKDSKERWYYELCPDRDNDAPPLPQRHLFIVEPDDPD